MRPIFCKDKLFFAENSSLCSIFFINKWEKVCKAVGRKGRRAPVRRMKLLDSNEIRQLRDVCIFVVNGIEI